MTLTASWAAQCVPKDHREVEVVGLPGSTVSIAVLIEVFSVEHLAAVIRVENLFCDVRSRCIRLVICKWKGDHHFALVLDHFCKADAIE